MYLDINAQASKTSKSMMWDLSNNKYAMWGFYIPLQIQHSSMEVFIVPIIWCNHLDGYSTFKRGAFMIRGSSNANITIIKAKNM